MALDPNLKDQMDPHAWQALEALDREVEALKAVSSDDPPIEHTMVFRGGRTFTYRLVEDA